MCFAFSFLLRDREIHFNEGIIIPICQRLTRNTSASSAGAGQRAIWGVARNAAPGTAWWKR